MTHKFIIILFLQSISLLGMNLESKQDTLGIKKSEIDKIVWNPIKIQDSLKFASNYEKEKVEMLDSQFKGFIEVLDNDNFSIAKTYLSEVISDKIQDKQLKYVKELLQTDVDLKLTYYGIQANSENNVFKILHYEYVEKIDNPEFEKIKIIFDSKDKIYAVKPVFFTKMYKSN